MKTILIFFIFLLMTTVSFSQIISVSGTENKTTSIIFPAGIVHVDLGMKDDHIAVDIDPNVPNLLKLRLSSLFKSITNMLVVTQDDYVYSFEIRYADTLSNYVHILKKDAAVNAKFNDKNIIKTNEIIPDSISQNKIVETILSNKNNLMRSEITKKGKMSLVLKNIFVHDNDMYFHFIIENKSNLKYTVDFYNFFMTSNLKKGLKGVTAQDIQINFNPVGKELREILKREENIIMHVKKFTLEQDKIGIFEIFEKEGGRHLKIKIANTELLSATKI